MLGLKYYELSDHLGNVRAVVGDQKSSALDPATGQPLLTSLAPVLSSLASYYPFGQLQPGRYGPANGTGAGATASTYRFGYNGKEKDNNGELGLTTYDYGFRIYNPALGRFLSTDPLFQGYPWYTPYQYAGNTPISSIDLDGLEKVIVTNSDLRSERLPTLKKSEWYEILGRVDAYTFGKAARAVPRLVDTFGFALPA